MKKWTLRLAIALPLVAAGAVYAHALTKSEPTKANKSYTCPITGEELPCPKCCPLNGGK